MPASGSRVGALGLVASADPPRAPLGRWRGRDFLSITFGSMVSRASGFVTVLYLARTLGPAGYGEVSWAQAALVVGAFLADLGLQTLGIRHVAQDRAGAAATAGRFVALRICLAVPAALILCLFALVSGQPPSTQRLTMLFAMTLLVNGLGVEWAFIGLQSMELVGVARVIQALSYLLLLIVLVRGPDTVLFVPLAAAISALAAAVLLLLVLKRRHPSFRLDATAAGWLRLLRDSTPLGVADLLVQVYISVPLLMLGWFHGATATGYYGGAYRIELVLQELLGWFFLSLYPVAAERWAHAPDAVEAFLDRVLRIVLTCTIPIAFGAWAVAPQLLTWVLGLRFAGSVLPFQILCLNLIAAGGGAVYRLLVLLMKGHQREYLVAVATGAAISLVVGLTLIPVIGPVGAALAWLLAETASGVVSCWLSRPHARVPFWVRFWRPLVAGAVMAAACAPLVALRTSAIWIVPAGAVVYLGVLAALGGLDRTDLELVRRIVGLSPRGSREEP